MKEPGPGAFLAPNTTLFRPTQALPEQRQNGAAVTADMWTSNSKPEGAAQDTVMDTPSTAADAQGTLKDAKGPQMPFSDTAWQRYSVLKACHAVSNSDNQILCI